MRETAVFQRFLKDKSLSIKEIKGIIEQHRNPVISIDTDTENKTTESNNEFSLDGDDTVEVDEVDETSVVKTMKEVSPHLQPTKDQIFSSLSSFTLEEKMVVLSLLNTSFLPVDVDDETVQVVADKFKIHNALLTLGRVYSDSESLDATNRLFSRSILLGDGFSEIRWIYEKEFRQYFSVEVSDEIRVRVHPSIIENAKCIVHYCKAFRYSWFNKAKSSETLRLYELLVIHSRGIYPSFFDTDLQSISEWFRSSEYGDIDQHHFIEVVLNPAVAELNAISHITATLGFNQDDSNSMAIRLSIVKKQPKPPLENKVIIKKLRNWSDALVRDRKRVKTTGEVFTPTPLVQEILNKFPPEFFSDPTKTYLDPSCGNGQFLSEALIKKLNNGIEYPIALSTIYGWDIMPDNIKTSRDRLLCGMEQYRYIVERNITCANTMVFADTNDDHYDNWD